MEELENYRFIRCIFWLELRIMSPEFLWLKSPAYDPRNAVLLIWFSIVKLFMQATIPFRRSAKIRE